MLKLVNNHIESKTQEVNKEYWFRTTLDITNKTYFYHPTATKESVWCPSRFAEYLQNIKQKGYKQRLEYEIDNCLNQHGKVFLGALTFNDFAIPHYDILGVRYNVWDNDKIQQWQDNLCKFFKRVYHWRVKLCLIPEGGEGGETHLKDGYKKNAKTRGKANNPHWHSVLCFYPLENPLPLNNKIVNHMHQYYWQTDFKDKVEWNCDLTPNDPNFVFEKFKVAQYSDDKSYGRAELNLKKNGGQVMSKCDTGSASGYLCSYATKDIQDFERQNSIEKAICAYYYKEVEPGILEDAESELYQKYSQAQTDYPTFETWEDYVRAYVNSLIKESIHYYRVHHGYRVRTSQGFGECALDHIQDGKLKVRGKDGWEYQDIAPYYFRKHFYRVEKRLDKDGKIVNSYRPNGTYVAYQMEHFEENLQRKLENIQNTYQTMSSDVLMAEFVEKYGDLINVSALKTRYDQITDDVLYKFALYQHVYEGRNFIGCYEPKLNPKDDFQTFLNHNMLCDYCETPFNAFMDGEVVYRPYSDHSEFAQYSNVFYYLNLFQQFCREKSTHYWRVKRQTEKFGRMELVGINPSVEVA